MEPTEVQSQGYSVKSGSRSWRKWQTQPRKEARSGWGGAHNQERGSEGNQVSKDRVRCKGGEEKVDSRVAPRLPACR